MNNMLAPVLCRRSIQAMSAFLDISIVCTDAEAGASWIDEVIELSRGWIRNINAWDETSELAAVNRFAGQKPVAVSTELFQLLKRSLKICALTDGLFDVTFAAIDKVWYFDRPLIVLPHPDAIRASVEKIDYKNILLDETAQTAYLAQPGGKIELGAIGKGYIVNRISRFFKERGVTGGLINAGGDLTSWGLNEFGKPWKVGIVDPENKEAFIGFLDVADQSVATSGSYERYAEINGERYTHIINPKTGWPVRGLKSVTVLYPDAELADALATSAFLLGPVEGLKFLNNIAHAAGFLISDNDEHYYTDNFTLKAFVKNEN